MVLVVVPYFLISDRARLAAVGSSFPDKLGYLPTQSGIKTSQQKCISHIEKLSPQILVYFYNSKAAK